MSCTNPQKMLLKIMNNCRLCICRVRVIFSSEERKTIFVSRQIIKNTVIYCIFMVKNEIKNIKFEVSVNSYRYKLWPSNTFY
jgi:hypothetical protein